MLEKAVIFCGVELKDLERNVGLASATIFGSYHRSDRSNPVSPHR